MKIPMPSPRGTNHARLFLAQTFPGAGAAYDAAAGLDPDAQAKLLEILTGKLSDEDMAAVKAMLGVSDPDGTADEPADFAGKPKLDTAKVTQDAMGGTSYGDVWGRLNPGKVL